MARWSSLVGACAVLAALVGTPGVATACACGGVLSADPSLRVADELALITGDGTTETVVMRLDLATTTDDAALVVPTPSPATVSAAPAELFDDLAELSAPRVETVREWTFGRDADASALEGATAGVPGAGPGGPTVLQQVQLGPLEATTLTGGDLTGVRTWLTDNGYQLRPEISAGLDPYLRQGWSVVAMRLNTGSGRPLDGPLSPVTLHFASAELIYPMRMSAQARTPQSVTVYTLGAHRMQRVDADASAQFVDVDYAGPTAGRTGDALARFARDGEYLTKITTSITDPAAITSDFRFAPAPTDEPFRRVVHRYEYVDLTVPVVAVGLAATAAALVAGAIALTRRRGGPNSHPR